jgi:hypothetical protein
LDLDHAGEYGTAGLRFPESCNDMQGRRNADIGRRRPRITRISRIVKPRHSFSGNLC